jgi:hypothetical protein
MESFHEYMDEYKKQLQKGDIQKAYRGLMEYIRSLRLHFKTTYPDYFVSGDIYQGYMDMTYFSFFPQSLKRRKLKIAIVFVHDTCRFEVWLGGYNKQIQAEYWEFIKESDWNTYRVPSSIKGIDSIVEYILVNSPDFSNLDTLTNQIEKGTLQFIKDVEEFLSSHQ